MISNYFLHSAKRNVSSMKSRSPGCVIYKSDRVSYYAYIEETKIYRIEPIFALNLYIAPK